MGSSEGNLSRRLAAEGLGTAFLLATVIGSGIMGERLAAGNSALALLANSVATGCGLTVLIAVFGPISGAHFNPLVSLAFAARRRLRWRDAASYALVQFVAAVVGVMAAHFMFDEPVLSAAVKARSGVHQLGSEFLATFGLLLVVWSSVEARLAAAPALIGAYVTAAYWFTASTSFANPAVTLARCFSNTLAGIRPDDVAAFIAAQAAGAGAGTLVSVWLWKTEIERRGGAA